MGGKAGDGDLHSTREGQTQSPQNGTALSTIGKEEASGRLDKQTDSGKRGVGMRGWICSSALVPAGRLHAHAVPPAQRATAGARHEAARNGSDQSASDSLAMTFAGARQGMDWTGGGAPLGRCGDEGARTCGTTTANLGIRPVSPAAIRRRRCRCRSKSRFVPVCQPADVGMMASRTRTSICVAVRNSCCCSARCFPRLLQAHESIVATIRSSICPCPTQYTPIVLGPSSASPDLECSASSAPLSTEISIAHNSALSSFLF